MSFLARVLPRRRVSFIAQMEETECGAATLGMILAYHGCHVPLAELRESCGVSRDGTSAFDLMLAGERYGLETKAFRTELDGLPALSMPCILHWELNHFVVLERIDDDGAEILDPAIGRRFVTTDELSRAFTGVVLCAERVAGFQPRRLRGRSLQKFRRIAREAAAPISMLVVMTVVLELLALVQPALTQVVIDQVIRPRHDRWIVPLSIVFVASVALRGVLALARDRVVSGLAARTDLELSSTFVSHLVSLPAAYFAQRSVGDIVSRLQTLLDVREALLLIALGAFDAVLVFAYVALLFAYEPSLASVVLVFVLVGMAVPLAHQRSIRRHSAAAQAASSRGQGALVAAFADPESQKAFGAQSLLLGRITAARAEELNAVARTRAAEDGAQEMLVLLEGVTLAAIMWFGGRAVIHDAMTLGVFSSFIAISALLRRPTQGVARMCIELARLSPQLDRVDDVLDTPREVCGAVTGAERLVGSIRFEEVSFRYGPNSPVVLDRVSFSLSAGERLAIAGRSGSGKSTILKLALGLLRPTEGKILVDGVPLESYDLTKLRRRIGSVLVGGALFEDSVLDNLALDQTRTFDQVQRAADAACVDDVVRALPGGYHGTLEGGGRSLSGGQRQRMLLARALVKEPDVLLLDEASSALDRELESKVHSYLDALDCTMIIVAHRASALRLATRLIVLDAGRIVREGKVAELLAPGESVLELVAGQEAA